MLEPVDESSLKTGSSFFQSRYWAAVKSGFGWEPRYFTLDSSNLVVLVRTFRSGFSLAYIPYGPDARYSGNIAEISAMLKKHLPRRCIFIRYDFPWRLDSPADAETDYKKLIKAASDIQPPSTVILDLDPDEEDLLAGMKPKTRYNIRLSAKKGIKVSRCGTGHLEEWYEIYKETSLRDRIALHSLDYYKKVFELAGYDNGQPDIRLYMAESVRDAKNVAGIVTCFYNGKAWYLYGASLNSSREKMPAYALQWQAIRDAKSEGCSTYDFFGIPPTDNPGHPMHGLYRFKTGFGGRIIHCPGSYDYPLIPFMYRLYRAAEKARMYYFKKIRKLKI